MISLVRVLKTEIFYPKTKLKILEGIKKKRDKVKAKLSMKDEFKANMLDVNEEAQEKTNSVASLKK